MVEWLTGKRKAYTDKKNCIEIKADWSNGNVAMSGCSYGGTLPFEVATTGVEGLKTIIPSAGEFYDYTFYMTPTVYTVRPGHHLELILTTWDPYKAFLDESFENLDMEKDAEAIDYEYSYIVNNESIRVEIPVSESKSE